MNRYYRRSWRFSKASLPVLVLFFAGCTDTKEAVSTRIPTAPSGNAVAVGLPLQSQAKLEQLEQEIEASSGLSTSAFVERHQVHFTTALGYNPLESINLPEIQASGLKLNEAENQTLQKNGFVISNRQRFAHFVDGYKAAYLYHLPVYVSADSILYALHRSYDDILKGFETGYLATELKTLLNAMRAHLGAGSADAMGSEAKADADLYLAVASSLLNGGGLAAPVAGGSSSLIKSIVEAAEKGVGTEDLVLFGDGVDMDFSQFTVRGHYLGDATLEKYFRAMMWLGRTEIPLMSLDKDKGQLVFNRRAFNAMLALRATMDDEDMTRFKKIDAVVRAFVGEPDSMTPPQTDNLLKTLNVTDMAAALSLDDNTIAAAIVGENFGEQKIASQIIITPLHEGTLPLASSFQLLGQRYVVDSHVFSNVVYDRANPEDDSPRRMMPNPLDVAFAALGNDQAAQMLTPELNTYNYAPYLENMRTLVNAHGDSFWEANLYNIWLSALRALSPSASEMANPASAGLPNVAATEMWGRRILSAQLASWAELRRDTILYAKQSYTSGISCEYPDAYVDPYPEFFARIEAFATAGMALGDTISSGNAYINRISTYFAKLGEIATILREMAEHQRTGMPHSKEHIAFINRAVTINMGCGGAGTASGWFADLFYDRDKATEYDPAIADVHTQPTDESGNMVGHVLHVGTGVPRLMVATVDTCSGPRAYVGVVSAYHEKITDNLERLNDKTWAETLKKAAEPEVSWMSDLVVK